MSGSDQRRVWFDRRFELGLPTSAAPDIIERLRGTPLRLEERLEGLSAERRSRRTGEAWSIQEHAGHMLELETLWLGRVDDFMSGNEELREADLENRATWEAGFNERPVDEILRAFRRARAELVSRVEQMDSDGLARTALHPRLRPPMSVVDLCFFVAEHDDHHLAAITALRVSAT